MYHVGAHTGAGTGLVEGSFNIDIRPDRSRLPDFYEIDTPDAYPYYVDYITKDDTQTYALTGSEQWPPSATDALAANLLQRVDEPSVPGLPSLSIYLTNPEALLGLVHHGHNDIPLRRRFSGQYAYGYTNENADLLNATVYWFSFSEPEFISGSDPLTPERNAYWETATLVATTQTSEPDWIVSKSTGDGTVTPLYKGKELAEVSSLNVHLLNAENRVAAMFDHAEQTKKYEESSKLVI